MNITKKHKLYFRDNKGSIRRLDKLTVSIYGSILTEFLKGSAGKRYAKLNKDVKKWNEFRPIQLIIPLSLENEFKILQQAVSKKEKVSRIEISYNGSWRPLCDLQLEKVEIKPE